MTEQRIKEISRLLVAFIIVVSSLLIIFAVYNQLQSLAFGSSADFLFEGSKFIGPVLINQGYRKYTRSRAENWRLLERIIKKVK